MKYSWKVAFLWILVLLHVQAQEHQLHWYKGNTHTHTLNSDGDSTPDDVVKWYREQGYDFLFITDHDMVTNVDSLNALFDGGGQFLVIRGEEVTSNFGDMHVHVNALNPTSGIEAQRGTDARDTLEKDVDVIRAAKAIAQVNHPNFFWQSNADDIASVRGARLLEIMNMHPEVNSFGAGPEAPSAEELWDQVLSRGMVIWGVASDDSHGFKRPWDSKEPRPGQGWIVVRAQRLTTAEIMNSIEKGEFYASTGVELQDYKTDEKQITIAIKPNDSVRTKYRVEFIGKNGRVLQDGTANPAQYSIVGNEGYVRARITDSNGRRAWTQPVFTDKRKLP